MAQEYLIISTWCEREFSLPLGAIPIVWVSLYCLSPTPGGRSVVNQVNFKSRFQRSCIKHSLFPCFGIVATVISVASVWGHDSLVRCKSVLIRRYTGHLSPILREQLTYVRSVLVLRNAFLTLEAQLRDSVKLGFMFLYYIIFLNSSSSQMEYLYNIGILSKDLCTICKLFKKQKKESICSIM